MHFPHLKANKNTFFMQGEFLKILLIFPYINDNVYISWFPSKIPINIIRFVSIILYIYLISENLYDTINLISAYSLLRLCPNKILNFFKN